MVVGRIGEIELDIAHLTDSTQSFEFGVEESPYPDTTIVNSGVGKKQSKTANVPMENWKAHAVIQMASQNQLVWVDTSTGLNYYDFLPRGWCVLKNAEPTYLNPDMVTLKIEYISVSNNKDELLKARYTKGVNDPTRYPIEDFYNITDANYLINDTFTTFDSPAKWGAMVSSGITSGSITVDGSGNLQLTGTGSVNNKWGGLSTSYNTPYNPPYTMEFSLSKSTTPTTNPYVVSVFLSSGKITNPLLNTQNFIRVSLFVYPTSQVLKVEKQHNKQWVTYYSETLATNPSIVDCRLTYNADSSLTFERDVRDGYGFIKKVSGVKTYFPTYNLYVAMGLYNFQNSAATGKINQMALYQNIKAFTRNIVPIPKSSSSYYTVTPDFYRTAYGGDIPCYVNPQNDLFFHTDPLNLYDLSVRAWSKNNPAGEWRRAYSSEDLIDLTTGYFYVSNGLIKMETTPSGVVFNYGTASGYTVLNTFTIPNLKVAKIVKATPDFLKLQLNKTYWIMSRGKSHLWVEHPDTDIGFTAVTYAYNDGSERAVSSGSPDITLNSNFFANLYNKPAGVQDKYCLQIVKTYPQTIKYNSLPADLITGIGWFDKDATGYDTATERAREFITQTRVAVGLVRP